MALNPHIAYAARQAALNNGLGAETMNGVIDDVRVESVVRSAAYIATQYRNGVGLYAAT